MEDTTHWSLDKRVPIALIITIAIQTGGIIWWASSISERVNTLERDIATFRLSAPIQAERVVRIEAKLESVNEGIQDLKRLLRRDPQ